MADKFNSKITLKTGEVLIDLTQDDVRPEHVQKDIYFHDKKGVRQQGTNTKTVDASAATAEAAEVLIGRTFGKGNEMQTGTMSDNSGKDVIISDKTGTSIPVGYSDGSGKARLSDADIALLVPGSIKKGVTILGIEGAYGAESMSSITKEVTPSFEEQVFNPTDEGVDFFGSVKVNAISVTRTENEAGGITVTIG